MVNTLKKLINTGAEGLPEKEARRTRVVNMMAICAVFFPFLYSLFYIYIGAYFAMKLNWIIIVLYSLTFYLNQKQKRESAKLWILSIYTLHIFILTEFVFSSATGLHYYYMALPPMSFLIYKYPQFLEKTLACILPVVFVFICEIFDFSKPLIQLTSATNHIMHLSTILFMFAGLIFIIFLFSSYIKKNEDDLVKTIETLEKAMTEIKTLKGLIPICSQCKKIRDDKGFWNHLESHIQKHSYAKFSHGICPDCSESLYGKEDWYQDLKK